MFNLNENVVMYYHNLKFDGEFILDLFLRKWKWKQAFDDKSPLKTADMPNKSINYLISDSGDWYCIKIKYNMKVIEIRDSLKLMPFSLRKLGKDFKTEHQKLDMEYEGFRYAGCEITEEEKKYIENDIHVLREALEIMFEQGHKKLTIGSCCMTEFKHTMLKCDLNRFFPDISTDLINPERYGYDTAWMYIKQSYHGGITYVRKGLEGKIFRKGCVFDVNSLYPSMMHSDSGNFFPIGKPHFWRGKIPKDVTRFEGTDHPRYYFITVECRFKLKPKHVPCIQIKHDLRYKSTEWLESSDPTLNGKSYKYMYDEDGNPVIQKVTLTLTCTDWELIQQQYDLYDVRILHGCWFYAIKGVFDEYINHYAKIKQESTGAVRAIAKLFLNNLYGKFATNNNSSFKTAEYDEDKERLEYTIHVCHDKEVGYIPIGSAITSYARRFTILAAQANYDNFIYCDTDSIHCCCDPTEIVDVPEHPTAFCHWKNESEWDVGMFVRPKTYIEHVIREDHEDVTPYWNMKCAGMPSRPKDLFIKAMTGYKIQEDDDYNETEREFIEAGKKLEDFKVGLSVPSKLKPKRIKGGIILVETPYTMRKGGFGLG